MDQTLSAELKARVSPGAAVATADHSSTRALIQWLLASAVCVILTLIVGGATRLTESGLSITEWRPVSGVLPPTTVEAWRAAYEQYLQIPEAQTVHQGITLEGFQRLFWWEWAHRLSARIAGLVIAVPFFVLLVRGRIPRPLVPRLLALPLLTAAQGALGWYMVKSGLTERTDVSQYRLVAHLGLALVIYVIAMWTAMSLYVGPHPETARRERRLAVALAVLAFVTILSGGFVAGLDAGHVYNTFPLMGDGIVPNEYGELTPAWRNWFDNPVAVQFNHRLLAMIVLVTAFASWWRMRQRASDGRALAAWNTVVIVAVLQVLLGISTLLLLVPLSVAALHQLGAVALLTAAMWAAAVATAAPPSPAVPST